MDSATNDANALPVVTRDITIEGNGATFDRAAGAPSMRFLEVRGGDTLTLRNLTLEHGSYPPVDGHVVNPTYAGHSVGGAIRCTDAEIVLEDVVLHDNEAESGGAVFAESCPVELTGVTFAHNTAGDGDGGAVAEVFQWEDGSDLNITDGEFEDNSASNDGGALFAETFQISVSGSAFRRNAAGRDGGGMWVAEPYFNYWVEIEDTTVARNTAEGIGGGIYVGDCGFTVVRSSIWGNDANLGGGMAAGHNVNSQAEVTSSTISGNHASNAGGGIYQYDWGNLTLKRATIADNDAPTAPALRVWGQFDALNTLIAYSSAAPTGMFCDITPGGWVILWKVGSLSEGDCLGINQIRPGAAELQQLGQNGGPTRTQAIGMTSAAKDAGDPSDCPGDQRYVGTYGPACDVGAYEWQLVATPMPVHF